MVSRRLLEAIQSSAPKLAADLVEAMRHDSRARAYSELTDAQYQAVVLDLYTNLGEWLQDRAWRRIQLQYEQKGRQRYQDGIPLEQLVYSLSMTKRMLLDFIRGSIAGTADERDLELNLILSVSDFFDRAIYHTVLGYQDAQRSAGKESAPMSTELNEEHVQATAAAVEQVQEHELPPMSRAGDVGQTPG